MNLKIAEKNCRAEIHCATFWKWVQNGQKSVNIVIVWGFPTTCWLKFPVFSLGMGQNPYSSNPCESKHTGGHQAGGSVYGACGKLLCEDSIGNIKGVNVLTDNIYACMQPEGLMTGLCLLSMLHPSRCACCKAAICDMTTADRMFMAIISTTSLTASLGLATCLCNGLADIPTGIDQERFWLVAKTGASPPHLSILN